MTSAFDQMAMALVHPHPVPVSSKKINHGNPYPKLPRIPCPVGQRFGMLVVMHEGARYFPDAKGYRGRRWPCCRCDCGIVRDVNMANIRRGNTRSCGCQAGVSTRFTTKENP